MYNNEENKQPWTYEVDPAYMPQAEHTPDPQPKFVPQKKEKKFGPGKVVALALCCSLVGGILGAVGGALAVGGMGAESGHSMIYEGQRENTVIDITKVDTGKLMTPAEVYAANVNSTVGITTTLVTTNFWGYQTADAASGSGFIITEDGYILTNFHVIKGASAVSVALYDGTSLDARVAGYDESNDLAILKVEAQDLTPVILGDSDNMNVGDTVVAIGNPLGELTFSLTEGVVSALEREVTTSTGVTMNLMQTDCAINSGNSGGALFNLYGEVIGITNAKYSSNGSSNTASIDNIGFAIPYNGIRAIVESVLEKGYVSKPYIGVSVTDVSEETQSYGLPQGAAVKEIVADSPAQKAGLQVNDIITKVNDTEITGSQDLVKFVRDCKPGEVLKLTVYRQGGEIQLELTVEEKITDATQPQQQQPQQQPQQQQPQQQEGFGGFGGFGNFGDFFGNFGY